MGAMSSVPVMSTAPAGAVAEQVEHEVRQAPLWVTKVWDDPVNLMSYVTHVFMTHFGYSNQKATELMLQVHNEGKAVVSSGTREEMEADASALHDYGLWATIDQAQ